MGGDHGLATTIPASLKALKDFPKLHLLLVGDEVSIAQTLSTLPHDTSRVTIVHAEQLVDMDEAPSKALRGKRKSSMRLAIDAVNDGRAGAAVSAGNTGALMGTAKFVLKTLPGIDRPAICGALPMADEP